ncbi:MAG: HipA N-terminal domain-containing protein [Desulfobulbaceae bacterium]|nr:HipA N-terminal domain-containing protein [Desulfobulbaceae bacterium]
MRKANVFFQNILAGQLLELETDSKFRFIYAPDYAGPPISLTMPVQREPYDFTTFPPFFDGLLPEGFQLEALLRLKKIDRNDKFGQLMLIGADTVGAVTIHVHQAENDRS